MACTAARTSVVEIRKDSKISVADEGGAMWRCLWVVRRREARVAFALGRPLPPPFLMIL